MNQKKAKRLRREAHKHTNQPSGLAVVKHTRYGKVLGYQLITTGYRKAYQLLKREKGAI